MTALTIGRRFNGPPESGNGGYVCGSIAEALRADLRVRLTRPPPLETPLQLVAMGDDTWQLEGADGPVALAAPHRLTLDVPEPPRYVDAVWASQHYAGFQDHPFPECFVCGPQRRRGDGLRIFAGQLDGMVAAPWLPADSLDAGDGKVAVRYHWAALDCPGFFAVSDGKQAMLLGEMQAHLDRRVRIGDPCTVIGWRIGAEGRKHYVGTAIFDVERELCARASATWIAIENPAAVRAPPG